jgi:FMN phosphatase YigB (HAD superfamily)
MGCQPERVVFIDDKSENVEAARAVGMHAFVTDSVVTTRAGLTALLGFVPRLAAQE